jgi:hypothetical protein
MNFFKSSCLLVASVSSLVAMAQKNDVLKTQFPNAEAVYTNLLCQVNISLDKENKISVNSDHAEDLLFLTPNAVQMMSRGRIYHSSFNVLKDWNAYTQLPENKRIKIANTTTASSRQDYVFYDDTKQTSFDFAGAVSGATRHLAYQLQHSDAHLLTPYYFDRYFPVLNGELRITFPDKIKVKYLVKGVNSNNVVFTESKKRDKVTYSFKVSDFSSVSSYADAPDNAYYATHVIFYIDKVEQSGTWQNFLSTPADLFRYNYGFIKNTNATTTSELKSITDSIIHDKKTNLDKAAAIYRWVQTHIKYVAFEDGLEGFVPREASLVCSRRFGDCKDMASILAAMLRHAQVPAYFTWIGTRDLPYTYTETPLPIVDNHMICAIKSGDAFIFLDGTDNGCVFGMPPYHIQGKQAMIALSDTAFKLVEVPVMDKERNLFTDSTFLEFNGTELTGKLKINMTGYWASSLYSATSYRTAKETEDYFKGRYARGNNKIKFSNWQFSIAPDHNNAVVTADFELPDFAKRLGNEVYLNLNLFKWYEHDEIDFPKRKAPIEYGYLKKFAYTTLLKVPEGYRISYLPQSHTFKNDVWAFDLAYQQSGQTVSLMQNFSDEHLLLYPDQFEKWNKVLEGIFPEYKQTIVLTKN